MFHSNRLWPFIVQVTDISVGYYDSTAIQQSTRLLTTCDSVNGQTAVPNGDLSALAIFSQLCL